MSPSPRSYRLPDADGASKASMLLVLYVVRDLGPTPVSRGQVVDATELGRRTVMRLVPLLIKAGCLIDQAGGLLLAPLDGAMVAPESPKSADVAPKTVKSAGNGANVAPKALVSASVAQEPAAGTTMAKAPVDPIPADGATMAPEIGGSAGNGATMAPKSPESASTAPTSGTDGARVAQGQDEATTHPPMVPPLAPTPPVLPPLSPPFSSQPQGAGAGETSRAPQAAPTDLEAGEEAEGAVAAAVTRVTTRWLADMAADGRKVAPASLAAARTKLQLAMGPGGAIRRQMRLAGMGDRTTIALVEATVLDAWKNIRYSEVHIADKRGLEWLATRPVKVVEHAIAWRQAQVERAVGAHDEAIEGAQVTEPTAPRSRPTRASRPSQPPAEAQAQEQLDQEPAAPVPAWWAKVLNVVEGVVTAENFACYFKTLRASDDGDKRTVHGRDQFFEDWVQLHYTGLLDEVAAKVGEGFVLGGRHFGPQAPAEVGQIPEIIEVSPGSDSGEGEGWIEALMGRVQTVGAAWRSRDGKAADRLGGLWRGLRAATHAPVAERDAKARKAVWAAEGDLGRHPLWPEIGAPQANGREAA